MRHLFLKKSCSQAIFCVKTRVNIHWGKRFAPCCYSNHSQDTQTWRKDSKPSFLTSKEIRKMFLSYFIEEQGHTYIHSSPVFLNSDPSLLFVNAGMNQFRSVLLNKTLPSHPFHDLKRAVNSQKCIRITGKHNDLEDVGNDFHHHTFFEMLGNWSFGDYFKKEACKMAWELLTKVYGINPDRLYVTYFGGDNHLNLPADEECKNIWLNLGVSEAHILPFGAKENFWDMGDVGPCGPCTEIHYDYLGHQPGAPPPLQRINKNRLDMIEIWNLVFIQHERGKLQTVQNLFTHNVDTGMGLERLTAVLQGTPSNYDTDIFIPLFRAIEENFKVKPYESKTGKEDIDGMDTAYRIIADHSRMFTVAIADGLFPDNYDAGFVLRKIIRRSAYLANCVMKTRPGALSSIIPYVAESLDFFPEIREHVDEIMTIVNEEEKILHGLINRGRKARNKMASDAKEGIFEGKKMWDLYKSYGLDERIIQDLVEEINLKLDWDGFKIIQDDQDKILNCLDQQKVSPVSSHIPDLLKSSGIPNTDDSFKYNYSPKGSLYSVMPVSSTIVAIIHKNSLVQVAENKDHCFIVTKCTNFYSEAGGQVGDNGEISGKDFSFKVKNVHFKEGYVFHEGYVQRGCMESGCKSELLVDEEHRLNCMRNHTATHLLNASLREILPYTAQRSSYVGPTNLKFGFSARAALSEDQVALIESFVNNAIQKSFKVVQTEMALEEVLYVPNVIMMKGEEYPDQVKVISIGNDLTVEPCCGTHVHTTSDIGKFIIIPHKSQGGTVKYVKAVTGPQADLVQMNGEALEKEMQELCSRVNHLLESKKVDKSELVDQLTQIRHLLHNRHSKIDIPLRNLKAYEELLRDLKLKLTDATGDFLESDAPQKNQVFVKQETRTVIPGDTLKRLQTHKIAPAVDTFKYNYHFRDTSCNVEPIVASITMLLRNGKPVDYVEVGQECMVLTDKTCFYSSAGGQVGDKGQITGKNFLVEVDDVRSEAGYVLHHGWVEKGKALSKSEVALSVHKAHRYDCSLNHTAVHLLHAAVKKILPYAYQRSVVVDPAYLQLYFSSKKSLTMEQIEEIEELVNTAIQQNMQVSRSEVSLSQANDVPNLFIAHDDEFTGLIMPIISIGSSGSESPLISVEACHGTHVHNTSELGNFIVISHKTVGPNEKAIRAVTGKTAKKVLMNGEEFLERVLTLKAEVDQQLAKKELNYPELWDLLKTVRVEKGTHDCDVPLVMFRTQQNELSKYVAKLTDVTKDFVQDGFKKAKEEMKDVLKTYAGEKCIIHELTSVGDGKKIINLALSFVTDRPAMFFVREGLHSVICSCSVPKDFVNSSFSALLWIHPVATLLKGEARSLEKDPQLFYSVISDYSHKVPEAISAAQNFVSLHIPR